MSRELHDGFDAWLAAPGRGELSRDLAVHASGCDACLASTAAMDSLVALDLDAAGPPPLRTRPMEDSPPPLVRAARYASGAVAVVLLGAGVALGIGTLLPERGVSQLPATPTPTTAEGILGAVGRPSVDPEASELPSASTSPSPGASASAAPTAEPADALGPEMAQPAAPTRAPTPQPIPVATARPTVNPTPVPTSAPTQQPTPSATAVPTATPTPEPDPIESPIPTTPPLP